MRKQKFARSSVDSLENARFAAGHHDALCIRTTAQRDQGLLEGPVLIPDITVVMLVMPHQFAGLGPQCNGRIRIQAIVVSDTGCSVSRAQKCGCGIGITHAEVHQVEIGGRSCQ